LHISVDHANEFQSTSELFGVKDIYEEALKINLIVDKYALIAMIQDCNQPSSS
jgi:hypothetical protein